ncbi:unnamed protein product [Dibothriocephalus latus]|uniref:Uncharacterized protein n=1 Tax=Dibothriocephalus latus TaxID=60516 RepID=A0A3P7PQL8_DIBLA|nr:unnamed protein product [Dibothriocephalus latus]
MPGICLWPLNFDDGATLLKLHGDSLTLLDSYTVPSQSKENFYCNPSVG